MLIRLLYLGSRVFQFFVRPVTLGVRVLLVREGQVLLIRHTYLQGWYLPGGGMKRGETLEAAIRREAREEAGVNMGALTLLGAYSKFEKIRSDHNVLFLCTEFDYSAKHDGEIAEVRMFDLKALPGDLHTGHRRRIEDWRQGLSVPNFGVW